MATCRQRLSRKYVVGVIWVWGVLLSPWALGSQVKLAAQEAAASVKEFAYNFANGNQGWAADFADYPEGEEEYYRLAFDFIKLPSYLATNRFALRLSGNNHSDDLCMFLRKRISGLQPNTNYRVEFSVRLASNAPIGAAGIGGAPGESVFVKAGVSLARPTSDPILRFLNIDKGNQGTSGDDAIVIGHVGVNTPVFAPAYRFKVLENRNRVFQFRTDDLGKAWLFFCTDSGFEGLTRVYVVEYSARFIPIKP